MCDFFSSNFYIISPVASTIAVFVSGTIPMLLLRGMDHFEGWKKITTKRKIKEAIGIFIDQKLWIQLGQNSEGVGSEASAKALRT